jgi:DNA repair protein RadC
VGLCRSADDLELSDPRTHRSWHLPSPPEADPSRCRQILGELLKPIGSDAPAWADRLIGEFGSLGAVLAAPATAQKRVLGNERGVIAWLATLRSAMLHALRREALKGRVLGDSRAVMDYLFAAMAHQPVEQLRVLYLNTRNRLLLDETVLEGSINVAPIYPREIVKRSLELGATALILVHNHPSGDPEPSDEDIRITRLVAAAGVALDIKLHDHVIIARSGWISFRAAGYL